MFFLIGVLLNPLLNCSAQDAQIRIQTLRCDAGIRFHPTEVSVAVFDASRIPEILSTYRELQPMSDKLNDGPNVIEAADKLTSRLKKLISSTPAFARRRSLPRTPFRLSIPRANRVVIFGILETEYDPFPNFAEVEVSPSSVNSITLSFSTAEDAMVPNRASIIKVAQN
jgi:hypothetical protein